MPQDHLRGVLILMSLLKKKNEEVAGLLEPYPKALAYIRALEDGDTRDYAWISARRILDKGTSLPNINDYFLTQERADTIVRELTLLITPIP